MVSFSQWKKWVLYGNASIPNIILENYKKMGLSDMEMMLLIHIHTLSAARKEPGLEQLQERMSCSLLELTKALNRLRKDSYIEIYTSYDQDGKANDLFSIEPLWDHLYQWHQRKEDNLEKKETSRLDENTNWPDIHDTQTIKNFEGQIFKRFEEEFGRTLSPMECETITIWLDENNYTPAIILLALKEAVISNKLSLRYIDRILFEWQKHQITTLEEAREYSKKFRRQQNKNEDQQNTTSKQPSFPFYNWLEK